MKSTLKYIAAFSMMITAFAHSDGFDEAKKMRCERFPNREECITTKARSSFSWEYVSKGPGEYAATYRMKAGDGWVYAIVNVWQKSPTTITFVPEQPFDGPLEKSDAVRDPKR